MNCKWKKWIWSVVHTAQHVFFLEWAPLICPEKPRTHTNFNSICETNGWERKRCKSNGPSDEHCCWACETVKKTAHRELVQLSDYIGLKSNKAWKRSGAPHIQCPMNCDSFKSEQGTRGKLCSANNETHIDFLANLYTTCCWSECFLLSGLCVCVFFLFEHKTLSNGSKFLKWKLCVFVCNFFAALWRPVDLSSGTHHTMTRVFFSSSLYSFSSFQNWVTKHEHINFMFRSQVANLPSTCFLLSIQVAPFFAAPNPDSIVMAFCDVKHNGCYCYLRSK